MTQTIAELEPLIIEWAKAKGLILHPKEQALNQHKKTEEEIQEFLEAKDELDAAIAKKCESGMWAHRELQHRLRLEAGDVLVTLVIQCAIHNFSLSNAVTLAAEQGDARAPIHFYARAMGGYLSLDAHKMVQLDIGLIALTLQDAIRHYELILDECLKAAWLNIRDRTGCTIDGVFVKAEDLATP